MSNIGKRLKDLRKKFGLSQLALSQMSGISQASIARIESNQQKNLKTETIEKLGEALGIPVYQLLEKPGIVKEETPSYGAVRMLPVINLKEFTSKKIPSLLKESAMEFEPSLSHVDNAFFLKATDSLISIPYINEGDLILVEPEIQVNDGDHALFFLNDKPLIGRLFYSREMRILQPIDRSINPIVLSGKRKHGITSLSRVGEIRKKL